jgi:hypothetical protein
MEGVTRFVLFADYWLVTTDVMLYPGNRYESGYEKEMVFMCKTRNCLALLYLQFQHWLGVSMSILASLIVDDKPMTSR